MARSFTPEEMAVAAAVGERLKARRLEAGFANLHELAKVLDLPGTPDTATQADMLGRIERGLQQPRPALLIAVGAALGVPGGYFLPDWREDDLWQSGYRAGLHDAAEAVTKLLRV